MIVGKAIYHLLTNATDVTDIVSTRIYPEIAQQDADLPYIVYNVANNEPTDTKPEPSKLDTAQVEVNIYSDSYTECIDLAVAVRAALDRVKGTYAGVNVQSIQYLNEIIDFDEPQRAYNISADYDVRISRSGFEIAQGSPITGVQLGELSDVDVDGVSNGQLIAYNSTSGNWEAADDATGSNTLTGLTDTSITTPADRESLIYDSGNWVNDNLSKSDVGLANVDNTSDDDKPVSSATQTALNAKADTSAVPTELNDLSDVTITGTPSANEALIFDTATSSFKSLPNFTNRFEDEAENNKPATPFVERVYTVKADGDGIFIDAQSDTPTAGKVIQRKIYQKAGFLESGDAIGDFTLINTFADDTAYSATTSTFEGFRDGDTYGTPPFTLIQTWDEEDAAPAFTGLLNESYGSGAAAAYSVRRLNGNYTGAAIQVERSSDNTTQDIGFDSNGDLDESALTTFCTGTTCRVRTWYDQATAGGTGSGNDAVQTTHANQPTIYTGGAIVKLDGRAAVKGLGVSGGKLDFTTVSHTGNFSHYMLQTFQSNAMPYGGPSGHFWYHMNANTLRYRIDGASEDFGGYQFQNLQRFLHSGNRRLSAGNLKLAIDGIDNATSNASTQTFDLSTMYAGNGGGFPYSGYIQEFLMYDSSKSASDQDSIESNVGDYFTQNTPLLDTYTGAAAAYSLRKLRTAYTGSAIRVRRASDNTESDIGFNVFGELDTVSLASFCSGTNGFVKVWYDQASTNDATQTNTANQPKIYDSSTGVVTENGKPAVQFDGSNDILKQSGGLLNGLNSYSLFSTFNPLTSATAYEAYLHQAVVTTPFNNTFELRRDNANDRFNPISGQSLPLQNTTSSINNSQLLVSILRNGATTNKIYQNGTFEKDLTSNSYTINAGDFEIGGRSSDVNFASMKAQEFVIYGNDQSSNRTNIESNINTFYSVY